MDPVEKPEKGVLPGDEEACRGNEMGNLAEEGEMSGSLLQSSVSTQERYSLACLWAEIKLVAERVIKVQCRLCSLHVPRLNLTKQDAVITIDFTTE